MSTHTPGPWAVRDLNEVHETTNQGLIAEVACFPFSVGSNYSDEQIVSNACLICAAPDLLEALEEAKAELEAIADEDGQEPYNNTRINAALDKARYGEQL